MADNEKFSATALRDVLWETIRDLREDKIGREEAEVIAVNAREIVRVIATQLDATKYEQQRIDPELMEALSLKTDVAPVIDVSTTRLVR